MNYKDIIKSINNNDLKNMYLFYGREFYLIENSIENLYCIYNMDY